MNTHHEARRRPPHEDMGRTAYFVSTRTRDSLRPFTGSPARQAVEQLLTDEAHYGFTLLAYAFMPDHAHFVVVPASGRTISDTMRLIKGSISRRLGRGAIWQAGFFDKIPRDVEALNQFIRYTEGNPAKAGLPARYTSATNVRCREAYERFLRGDLTHAREVSA